MKYKKLFDSDGRTKRIILQKDGVYFSLTPKQAAEAINMLRQSLWNGIPLKRWN